MFKSFPLRGFSFLMALATGGSFVSAAPLVTIHMGPPIVNGNQVAIDVSINFDAEGDPTLGLVLIELGVQHPDTTPILHQGGIDFSRFQFDRNETTLPPGNPVPFTDEDWSEISTFGPDPFLSVVSYLLMNPDLRPNLALYDGTHDLGTLLIDMTGLPSDVYEVNLDSFDTAFFHDIFDPESNFETIPTDFVSSGSRFQFSAASGAPAIPEPSVLALGLMSMATMVLRRRRH